MWYQLRQLASSKIAERLCKNSDFTMLDEDMVLRALNAALRHLITRHQMIVSLAYVPQASMGLQRSLALGRDACFWSSRSHANPSTYLKVQ